LSLPRSDRAVLLRFFSVAESAVKPRQVAVHNEDAGSHLKANLECLDRSPRTAESREHGSELEMSGQEEMLQ